MSRDGTTTDKGTIDAAWHNSHTVGVVLGAHSRLGGAAAKSWTAGVLDYVRVLGAGSGLYQWFLTPPAVDPVRIDVRDSRLVGPIVASTIPLVRSMMRSWRHATVRRAGAQLFEWVRAGPVRLASAFLLLLSVTSLVATWQRTTPVGLETLAILLGVGLLGLRDDRPWSQLRETRTGRVLHALVGSSGEDAQR
jgi:hypothetical protein